MTALNGRSQPRLASLENRGAWRNNPQVRPTALISTTGSMRKSRLFLLHRAELYLYLMRVSIPSAESANFTKRQREEAGAVGVKPFGSPFHTRGIYYGPEKSLV